MQPEFEQILAEELPETEKLARAYLFILRQQQNYAQHEIELQKVVGNQEALVKEQIKHGVLKYSGEIFAYCYFRITGRSLPNDNSATTNFEKRAEFFKALGHPVRLLILNLVHARSRHGEELALILSLNQATISHHLNLLVEAGLLTSKKISITRSIRCFQRHCKKRFRS